MIGKRKLSIEKMYCIWKLTCTCTMSHHLILSKEHKLFNNSDNNEKNLCCTQNPFFLEIFIDFVLSYFENEYIKKQQQQQQIIQTTKVFMFFLSLHTQQTYKPRKTTQIIAKLFLMHEFLFCPFACRDSGL